MARGALKLAPARCASIAALAGLAACTEPPPQEPADSYELAGPSGGAQTVTIASEMADGTALTIEAGKSVSPIWPDGWAAYPAADLIRVTQSKLGGEDGEEPAGQQLMIVFRSDDAPRKIAEFYREQALVGGFAIASELQSNRAAVLAASSDNRESLTVNARKGQGATVVHLSLEQSFGQ